MQTDIAGKEHWDVLYEGEELPSQKWIWNPTYYHQDATLHALIGEINASQAKSVMEVGCGGSIWLPYIARTTGVTPFGLDYSEPGCDLTRQYLEMHEVEGKIWCADLFNASPEEIGRYDFVYSLGLAEHFSDLEGVLSAMMKFVRPGGTLFTLVPYLRSIHGLMMWIWQPELLRKHELISKRRLLKASKNIGLEEVHGGYLGVFTMMIVPWALYPRWPGLVPQAERWVERINLRLEHRLRRRAWFRGVPPFAPYVYAVGRKPNE